MQNLKVDGSVLHLISVRGPFCHLCGLILDFRPSPNIRIRATRDHIIPVSRGGRTTNNILLSHSYCNNKRGADAITDDIRDLCRSWVRYYIGQDMLDAAESYFYTTLMSKVWEHIERGNKIPSDIRACWSKESLWSKWRELYEG